MDASLAPFPPPVPPPPPGPPAGYATASFVPPPPAIAFLSEEPVNWGVYMGPEKTAKELRTLPDGVNASIRVFAPIMVGMGILCMLSGGVCLVSSALVIAQGAVWLQVTKSFASLAGAMGKNRTLAGSGCCGGPLTNLRGLSIAGIVFGVLEILLGLGVGVGIGAIILTPFSNYYCDNGYYPNCNSISVSNPFWQVGTWLMYAGGASIIGGAVNISMCVATMQLLAMLNSIAINGPQAATAAATLNPAFRRRRRLLIKTQKQKASPKKGMKKGGQQKDVSFHTKNRPQSSNVMFPPHKKSRATTRKRAWPPGVKFAA